MSAQGDVLAVLVRDRAEAAIAAVAELVEAVRDVYGDDCEQVCETSCPTCRIRRALAKFGGDDVTQPAAVAPVGVEAVRGAWLAAITLANNICVQESDRENDGDGSAGWINGTAECAKRIREYAHPTDAELLEMLDEAGANAAKAALAQQPAAPSGEAVAFANGRLEGLAIAVSECDRLTTALDYAGKEYRRPASAEQCANALRSIYAKFYRELHPNPQKLNELSGNSEQLLHCRVVIGQVLHWGGVPVHVTGTVTTSPGNWSLIDAALATKEPTT